MPPPPAPPAGITATFLGDSNVLQLSGYKNMTGSFDVEVDVHNGSTTTAQDFLVAITEQAPTLATVSTQTVSHTASLAVTLTAGTCRRKGTPTAPTRSSPMTSSAPCRLSRQ
jgi:hypothetical protein